MYTNSANRSNYEYETEYKYGFSQWKLKARDTISDFIRQITTIGENHQVSLVLGRWLSAITVIGVSENRDIWHAPSAPVLAILYTRRSEKKK